MRGATLVAVLAIGLGACATSADPQGDPPGASGGSDAPASMTGLVIDLIDHHTTDDELPVAYERFASLPDPEGSANDLDAYASLF